MVANVTGYDLLVTTFALVCASVLLVAGLSHAVNIEQLVRVIRAQRLFSVLFVQPLVLTLVAIELVSGAAGIAVLAIPGSPTLATRLTFGVIWVVYALFTAHAAVLVIRRPEAGCGCPGGDMYPVTGWVLGRAAVLGAAAASAVAFDPALMSGGLGPEAAVLFTASVAFGLLAWNLPDALGDPTALAWFRQSLAGMRER